MTEKRHKTGSIFYNSYLYCGKKRMSFLGTYFESVVLARLGYFKKKHGDH